jgi:hypothetical protein
MARATGAPSSMTPGARVSCRRRSSSSSRTRTSSRCPGPSRRASRITPRRRCATWRVFRRRPRTRSSAWLTVLTPLGSAGLIDYGDESPVSDDPVRPKFKEWFKPRTTRVGAAIHLDLAVSGNGDALGFAMGHVEELVEIDGEKKPYIVFDCLSAHQGNVRHRDHPIGCPTVDLPLA